MDSFLSALIAGVTSGTVISAIFGILFHKSKTAIEAEIKNQFNESLEVFKSTREWKEESVSELLGPGCIHLDRTKRAFDRWKDQNLFLEAKVIGVGNQTIRDLLLTKAHLIPPDLLQDAGELVEHYDRWLEEFEKLRKSENPDLQTKFVFVGPKGFGFPKESEKRFRERYRQLWTELYGQENMSMESKT